MGFWAIRTLAFEKWFEVAVCLFLFLFYAGCATTERLEGSGDKKSQARIKFNEALRAGSLNQQDKMVALLKEAVELDPNESKHHFYLGRIYFVQNDLSQAEREYLTSIKLNKDFKDSYRQLGLVYMQQGNWEKAIEYFREDLARPGTLQPQQVYNWIALCFYKLGKTDDAEIEWKKALEIKENAEIRLNLALTYINQERFGQAISSLEKALSFKPRFPQAHFELAQLYLKEEKKDQALEHFQQVIRHSPRGELAQKSKEYIQLIRPD